MKLKLQIILALIFIGGVFLSIYLVVNKDYYLRDGKQGAVIENHSTQKVRVGDLLVAEEIDSNGTVILVPYKQSNYIVTE